MFVILVGVVGVLGFGFGCFFGCLWVVGLVVVCCWVEFVMGVCLCLVFYLFVGVVLFVWFLVVRWCGCF